MATPVIAEIFIIGNEILIGDIQDTNTNWLCREINNIGGRVARVTVLRDELDVIAAEIRAALKRSPAVIFTSGGLGPTVDDLTLAALAEGLGVPVLMHEEAREMVRKRYDELAAEGILAEGGLNPAREKMAMLPEGAIPVTNSVGTAPGVMLHAGQTTIISLPGVPKELKWIFQNSLQPFLQKTFSSGTAVMRTITVRCNDESLMEPVLTRVVANHPSIYIKSLARVVGETPELDVTLTAVGTDATTLEMLLVAALKDLRDGLSSVGFSSEIKTED